MGYVELSEIWPQLSVRLSGVPVGERRARGRGVRVAIGMRGLETASRDYRAVRVDLAVLSTNAAATRCYQKCGFIHDAQWQQAIITPSGTSDLDWMTCYRPSMRASHRLGATGATAHDMAA